MFDSCNFWLMISWMVWCLLAMLHPHDGWCHESIWSASGFSPPLGRHCQHRATAGGGTKPQVHLWNSRGMSTTYIYIPHVLSHIFWGTRSFCWRIHRLWTQPLVVSTHWNCGGCPSAAAWLSWIRWELARRNLQGRSPFRQKLRGLEEC